jgi:hypothetical protein
VLSALPVFLRVMLIASPSSSGVLSYVSIQSRAAQDPLRGA